MQPISTSSDSPATVPVKSKWKHLLEFPLIAIVVALCFVVIPTNFVAMTIKHFFPEQFHNAAVSLLGLAVFMTCYFVYVRCIERRAVSELSTRNLSGELAAGLFIGALLFTATIAVLMALNVYQVSGTNSWTVVQAPLIMALVSGITEEVLFRGILFRLIERSWGSWIALSVSALIFGLLHLLNEHATLVGASAIVIEAGIMLGAAYMLTRRLWLCIGIHIAWNFVQAGVFSGVVSGAIKMPGLLTANIVGPDWLTGGEFGIEASAVAVVVCLAAGLTLLSRAVKTGQIIAPGWQRRSA